MTSDQHSCGSEKPAVHGVAGWLALAAAPTFAFMALLSMPGDGAAMLCSTGRDGVSLTGMVGMYLLMSVFHSTPWLKLLSGQR